VQAEERHRDEESEGEDTGNWASSELKGEEVSVLFAAPKEREMRGCEVRAGWWRL
jgi:hypothetical protein